MGMEEAHGSWQSMAEAKQKRLSLLKIKSSGNKGGCGKPRRRQAETNPNTNPNTMPKLKLKLKPKLEPVADEDDGMEA
ncbi:hypothetical protein AWZ03_002888 [Drosophila navojoa]|uniref:Uncharacterized protein n=1 Tax=Drosophila navojoa TaxID=7232 RepID=A0A484BPI1_DRONA|nr:hypothetical protein AWZ03_002888 [Drosophila navojoa]